MELGGLNASYAQMFHILFPIMRELIHLLDILRANTSNEHQPRQN